ncbi:hypothetical protein UMZ34_13565 [Halopseudomonas pachastrellae]|nr:hypothetical protein UMZ34_13565 [Halopseudomonas pachastrellae]
MLWLGGFFRGVEESLLDPPLLKQAVVLNMAVAITMLRPSSTNSLISGKFLFIVIFSLEYLLFSAAFAVRRKYYLRKTSL